MPGPPFSCPCHIEARHPLFELIYHNSPDRLPGAAAFDAVSPAQVALETRMGFSHLFPSPRLEDNLLGALPLAAVGESLVACAPACVPSDDLDQLIFVVGPRSEPMTTGLCWHRRPQPDHRDGPKR